MSDASDLPDIILDTLLGGFDVSKWKPATLRIFAASYAGKKTFQTVSGQVYRVPDETHLNESRDAHATETLIFKNRHEVDESTFSAAVDESFGVAGFSASASLAMTHYSKADSSVTTNVALNAYCKTIYKGTRLTAALLSSDFQSALAALTGENPDFENFFSNFGTHYIVQGYIGGTLLMRSEGDETVINTVNSSNTKGSLSAGFSDGIAKEDTKATVEESTRRSLGITDKMLTMTWYAHGGDGDGAKLSDFLDSVETKYALVYDANAVADEDLRPKFRPIWMLVTDATQQAALRSAWERYLGAFATAIQTNFIQPVSQNGFVFGMLSAPTSGVQASVLVKSDSNDSPAMVRAAASIHYGPNQVFRRKSFLTPVRKGDNLVVEVASPAGAAACNAFFVPFALDFANGWNWFNTNFVLNAEQDLILIGLILPDGHAQISATLLAMEGPSPPQDDPDGNPIYKDWTTYFGVDASSGPRFRPDYVLALGTQGCCIPVRKGTYFLLSESSGLSVLPQFSAWCVPLAPAFQLGAFRPVGGDVYNAATDGLLFGGIYASEGASGTAYLRVADRSDELQSGGGDDSILGAASVQYQAYVNRNSMTAFVRKGQYYRTSVDPGISGAFWFAPIQPT